MSAMDERSIKRPVKVALVVIAVLLALAAIGAYRSVFVAALVALIIGVLLEPIIRVLHRRLRIKHGVSVALTGLLLLGVVGGVGYAGYALVVGQARNLAQRGPEIRERVVAKLQEWTDQFAWLGLDQSQLSPTGYIDKVGGAVLSTLKIGLDGLTFAAIVFILALFIAANLRSYGNGCLTLFPPHRRPRASQLAQGSVHVVRQWFVSQIIVVSISATLTAVVLYFLGFDYWLVIAALTLVLDFVPFFGAILTGLVAAVLTLGTEPDKIWWVLLAYVVIQQVETDVLLPLVMKGRIQLPEAHLLVFVLVMGAALGVVGIFLSPAVFAVLHYLYKAAYVPWIERPRPPEADAVVSRVA